jgi:hypothetical protein
MLRIIDWIMDDHDMEEEEEMLKDLLIRVIIQLEIQFLHHLIIIFLINELVILLSTHLNKNPF